MQKCDVFHTKLWESSVLYHAHIPELQEICYMPQLYFNAVNRASFAILKWGLGIFSRKLLISWGCYGSSWGSTRVLSPSVLIFHKHRILICCLISQFNAISIFRELNFTSKSLREKGIHKNGEFLGDILAKWQAHAQNWPSFLRPLSVS
jgi:hypothetical protein